MHLGTVVGSALQNVSGKEYLPFLARTFGCLIAIPDSIIMPVKNQRNQKRSLYYRCTLVHRVLLKEHSFEFLNVRNISQKKAKEKSAPVTGNFCCKLITPPAIQFRCCGGIQLFMLMTALPG